MGKNIGFPCGTKIYTHIIHVPLSSNVASNPVMKCNVYMSRNGKKIVPKSRKRELGNLYVERKEGFSTLKCLFRVPQRIYKPKKHDNKNKYDTYVR